MVPASLSFIILEEYRFIMGDKNKQMVAIRWMRKWIATIIPNLELHFVFHPSINKGLSIGYDIISFMPINIHSVLHFAVAPLQLCKPPLYC